MLQPGGIILIACPDKRRTFDVSRPSTTIDHLLNDYYNNCNYPSLEHILEFAKAASEDLRQKSIKSPKEFYEWGCNCFESGFADAHCHVWTDEEFFNQIKYLIEGGIIEELEIVSQQNNCVDYNEFLIALKSSR